MVPMIARSGSRTYLFFATVFASRGSQVHPWWEPERQLLRLAPNHPRSCLSHLQGPVAIDAWRYTVGDALPAPPSRSRPPHVLSTAREPPGPRRRGLADHRVPVTTNHLPGGKPGSAAKIRAARLRRST